MGLFTWIKGLLQPQGDTIRVNCQTMPLAKWRRNGGYQPCSHGGTPNPPPSDFDDHLDREITRRRGSNLPAPGNKPAAPAEMPSGEQMERWKRAAIAEYLNDCVPTWRTAALLAFAEGRRQTQSPQLPPPGADPVATDEELAEQVLDLWPGSLPSTFQRAFYQKGRADERTAILRALGVEP
jgi:hypothetical protein